MTTSYKEIKVPSKNNEEDVEDKNITIDLDDDVKTTPPEVDYSFGEDEDDDEQKKPKEEKDEKQLDDKDDSESKKAKERQEKRTSRAQKRIKQLLGEKSELQQELEAARQEKQELQKQLKSGTKSSREAMKQSLESNIDVLSDRLAEAIENGESKETVKLQDEKIKAQMQLAVIEAELHEFNNASDTSEEKEHIKPKQQNVPQPSEKAIEWIEDYPQFKTDPIFHTLALTVSNQLVQEGYDDDSDDFYEELNDRLAPRFPEVFGTTDKNSVQYNKTSKNKTDDDGGDVKDKTSSNQDDEESDSFVEQTVSGASRSPSNSGKSTKKRGKNSVVLTPHQVKQAERWGLTMEQMARRIAHSEKNRDGSGYVPILMNKNNK